jgi:hypothetical protein
VCVVCSKLHEQNLFIVAARDIAIVVLQNDISQTARHQAAAVASDATA